MTDPLLVAVLLALLGGLLTLGVLYAHALLRLKFRTQQLAEVSDRHDRMVNLLAAASLAKSGGLRIPCRVPGWKAPGGINIEFRMEGSCGFFVVNARRPSRSIGRFGLPSSRFCPRTQP